MSYVSRQLAGNSTFILMVTENRLYCFLLYFDFAMKKQSHAPSCSSLTNGFMQHTSALITKPNLDDTFNILVIPYMDNHKGRTPPIMSSIVVNICTSAARPINLQLPFLFSYLHASSNFLLQGNRSEGTCTGVSSIQVNNNKNWCD